MGLWGSGGEELGYQLLEGAGFGVEEGSGLRVSCSPRFSCQYESETTDTPAGEGSLTVKHQDLELPWARRCRQAVRPPRGICRNRRLVAIRILPHGDRGSGSEMLVMFRSRVIPVIQQIVAGSGLAGGTDMRTGADYS